MPNIRNKKQCARRGPAAPTQPGRAERWHVDKSDLLEDVSVADRVVDLEFTVGQVCKIAGITKMQLDYWTVRGDIPTLGQEAAPVRRRTRSRS